MTSPQEEPELYQAVELGDNALLKTLLEAGNPADDTNGFALALACENGNLEAAQILVSHGADPLRDENTHLTTAASHGHTEICKLLIGLKANPATGDDFSSSHAPIRVACQHQHTETAAYLAQLISSKDIPKLLGDEDLWPAHPLLKKELKTRKARAIRKIQDSEPEILP